MNSSKLWTKDFIIITVTNVFIALNFYLLLVITSVFAMEKFNVSPGLGGLASGIFVIGALISRLVAGKYIERTGRKKMLYIGLTIGLIMILMYFKINSFIELVIIRFLHGLSYGISSTATSTIASSAVPKSKRGEGIGYFMLSTTLATAIGPFLGTLLSLNGNYSYIFLLCSVTAAISFIVALFLNIQELNLTHEEKQSMRGIKFSNFFEVKSLTISVICGLFYFCYSTVFSFINAYAKSLNLIKESSFFFLVIAIVIFLSRPVTGKRFDKKGENSIMYPGFLIFSAGMIFLSSVNNGFMLLAAGAAIGLGVGIIQSGGQTVAVNLAPNHRIGMANSTFFSFLDFGVGAGPFILGYFIPYTGYRGIYLIMGISAVFFIFIYHYFHGKNASTNSVETDSI